MKKIKVLLFLMMAMFVNTSLVSAATYTAVSCAGVSIPSLFPKLVYTAIKIIQFGVPIILIIFGMLDFVRAIMAQKEDEIKKGQQLFIKRLIAGAMVFLVVFVVQLVTNLITDATEDGNVWDCVSCFINNSCE